VDASTKEGKTTLDILKLKEVPVITIRIAVQNLLPHTLLTIVFYPYSLNFYKDNPKITKEEFDVSLNEAIINYPVILEQLGGISRMPVPQKPPMSEAERKANEDRM